MCTQWQTRRKFDTNEVDGKDQHLKMSSDPCGGNVPAITYIHTCHTHKEAGRRHIDILRN